MFDWESSVSTVPKLGSARSQSVYRVQVLDRALGILV